jgi:hypothetical protein
VIDRIIWRSSCVMDTVPSWFTYLDELTKVKDYDFVMLTIEIEAAQLFFEACSVQ